VHINDEPEVVQHVISDDTIGTFCAELKPVIQFPWRKFYMKRIRAAVLATLVAMSFTAVVFAAEAAKPAYTSYPAAEVRKDAQEAKTEATKAKADALSAKEMAAAEAKEAKAKTKSEANAAKAKKKADAKEAKAKVKADALAAKEKAKADAKAAKEAAPAAK
jgi:F0F1-type ATP synthase membrane subunit b/b'